MNKEQKELMMRMASEIDILKNQVEALSRFVLNMQKTDEVRKSIKNILEKVVKNGGEVKVDITQQNKEIKL